LKIKYTIIRVNSFFLLVLLCSGVFTTSCKKYTAATPAFYLKANDVSVVTTSTIQGSSSSKITELWLYLNGFYQGAYPIGSIIPIPNSNQNIKIDILAGIKDNGFNTKRVPWPFYEKIAFDTLIENGKTLALPIKFNYNPNTKFAWVEGFENTQGFTIVNSSISSATFATVTGADSFEGKSIKLELTNPETIAQIETALPYALPLANSNVYLELDYKCFTEFEIGVVSGTTYKPAYNFLPSTTWNKIYFSLAFAINLPPTSNSHKIYFKMKKNTATEDARLFLDNIKVVYL